MPVPVRPAARYAALGRIEEAEVGFMDKAKKLAEQAQQKLDEAQTQFNQNAAPQSPPQEGGVQYDAHGRPIQQDPPAGAASPPPQPTTAPTPDPAAPSAAGPEAVEEREDEPPPRPAPSGDANASPDPFKPL
jgi:hypothetical protein